MAIIKRTVMTVVKYSDDESATGAATSSAATSSDADALTAFLLRSYKTAV